MSPAASNNPAAAKPRDVRQPPKGEDWRDDWRAAGVLASSAAQRRAVAARGDAGLCAKCGQRVTAWQADHVVALHTLSASQLADYPAVLRFWAAGNLQCLGVTCGCHQAKTNLERSSNAKVLRLVKKYAAPARAAAKSKTYGKIGRKTGIYKPRPAPAAVQKQREAYAAQQRDRARAYRKAQRDKFRAQKKGGGFRPRPTLPLPQGKS